MLLGSKSQFISYFFQTIICSLTTKLSFLTALNNLFPNLWSNISKNDLSTLELLKLIKRRLKVLNSKFLMLIKIIFFWVFGIRFIAFSYYYTRLFADLSSLN